MKKTKMKSDREDMTPNLGNKEYWPDPVLSINWLMFCIVLPKGKVDPNNCDLQKIWKERKLGKLAASSSPMSRLADSVGQDQWQMTGHHQEGESPDLPFALWDQDVNLTFNPKCFYLIRKRPIGTVRYFHDHRLYDKWPIFTKHTSYLSILVHHHYLGL